jgi:ABC-type transport system substrate-binding protein
MKRSILRLVAASSLLIAIVAGHASSRPRYGGTVRVLLRDRVNTLDPQGDEEHTVARDRVSALIFERLTEMDALGQPQPRLATSWKADPAKRSWQFNLRLAEFHDGSTVTAQDVVASWTKVSTGWKISALDKQTVIIETPAPVYHLPEMLALPKFAVVKRNPDNTIAGTGPYKISDWRPGERVTLSANEDYWGGRSFPDSIEIQLASTMREQLLERQLGPYAAAELGVDQVRPLEQSNQNISYSRPSDLLVVLFLQPDSPGNRPGRKPVDPRIREALSQSINRATISNFILQKKAVPANGLLPQWLTGYEFLFPGGMNLERAKELRAETASLVIVPPISLAYDFADPVAKLVAERLALDAREAGITVQPYGESHVTGLPARGTTNSNADAVLLRIPLPSLEPSVALSATLDELSLNDSQSSPLNASRTEDLFEIERKTLQNFRVVPVAHLSQAVWLSNSAHNWQQQPNGAWSLDQLWMEGPR